MLGGFLSIIISGVVAFIAIYQGERMFELRRPSINSQTIGLANTELKVMPNDPNDNGKYSNSIASYNPDLCFLF
jgi:hypothetical protein